MQKEKNIKINGTFLNEILLIKEKTMKITNLAYKGKPEKLNKHVYEITVDTGIKGSHFSEHPLDFGVGSTVEFTQTEKEGKIYINKLIATTKVGTAPTEVEKPQKAAFVPKSYKELAEAIRFAALCYLKANDGYDIESIKIINELSKL